MIVTILSSPDENVIIATIDPEMIAAVMSAATEAKQTIMVNKWDTEKNTSLTITLNEE